MTEMTGAMTEDTLIVFGLVTLLGFFFWLVSSYRHRIQQQRIDFKSQVLARFESTEELSAFLQSESGRAFLGGGSGYISLTRVMIAVQLGVLLTAVGVGILCIAYVINQPGVFIPGILLGCGGIGFLLAASFTYWFAKHHGLLDEPARRNKEKFEP